MSDNYILMRYTNDNGIKVVSAIHFYDLSKFIKAYPDATPE